MSSKSALRAWSSSYDCEGCRLGIYPGSLFYAVARGFLDDLVSAEEATSGHWHVGCLDTVTLLIDLLPTETIAVTLHQS